MSSQTQLWIIISVPIGIVSLFVSYILLLKFKPMPKRKIIVGSAVGALILLAIVGISILNEIAGAVFVGLLLPPYALWTWFMVQPTIAIWNRKREDALKEHDRRRKNGK